MCVNKKITFDQIDRIVIGERIIVKIILDDSQGGPTLSDDGILKNNPL